MWLKRKSRNRRLGREHVLDVKLRSSKVRAARSRLLALGLTALLFVGFGTYVLYRGGDWLLDELVYENKAFAIEEIDLRTDGVIAVDQLRRWSGVTRGQNLLALDLAHVKRDLELLPMVQAVSIERVLPHTLRLRVFEREPVAQVTALQPGPAGGVETAVFLLDSDGYVMQPMDPRQRSFPPSPDERLPMLSGVNPNDLQPGRRIDRPQVQTALQLLEAFDHSPMAGQVEISRIDISNPETILLTTYQGGAITFGPMDLNQQLRRWWRIFDWGHKCGKAIATLDLAVTNNVPACWLEASAVPQTNVKVPKTLRTKRKHV